MPEITRSDIHIEVMAITPADQPTSSVRGTLALAAERQVEFGVNYPYTECSQIERAQTEVIRDIEYALYARASRRLDALKQKIFEIRHAIGRLVGPSPRQIRDEVDRALSDIDVLRRELRLPDGPRERSSSG